MSKGKHNRSDSMSCDYKQDKKESMKVLKQRDADDGDDDELVSMLAIFCDKDEKPGLKSIE